MSKDGQISVERIKEAFTSAAKTIRGDWANITPTIGMALTVLGNSWTDFVGKIETSTGIFSLFAQLILLVAANFNILAIVLAPVAISLAFLAGKLGLGLVITGFQDLSEALKLATIAQWLFNVAVSVNPYVLAAVAIAALIVGILYFTGLLSGLGPIVTTIWGAITSLFSTLYGYIATAATYVATLVASFVEWTGIMGALQSIASATMAAVVSMFSAIGAAIQAFVPYMQAALTPLFNSLVALVQALYDITLQIVSIFVTALTPAITLMGEAFKKVWDYISPTMAEFVKLLSDIYDGWKIISTFLTTNFLPAVKGVFEGWLFLIQSVVEGIRTVVGWLKTAIALFQQAAAMGMGSVGGGGAHYGAQFNAGEGFAKGGAFKVGGTNNGRDTTPVSFRAERGERVTVETKKQQRQSDNSNQAPSVNVPVQIVNVTDPTMVTQAMQSATGKRVIFNSIKGDVQEMKAILGIN